MAARERAISRAFPPAEGRGWAGTSGAAAGVNTRSKAGVPKRFSTYRTVSPAASWSSRLARSRRLPAVRPHSPAVARQAASTPPTMTTDAATPRSLRMELTQPVTNPEATQKHQARGITGPISRVSRPTGNHPIRVPARGQLGEFGESHLTCADTALPASPNPEIP